MAEALYRTYRPQTFKEVLGQEHIVPVLEKSIAEQRVAHAYLFSGSRGTGKTSVARIFAKELGTNERDLYEIDAASNRGIDDVRALREEIQTLPFQSEYKVYIIDEVHMLTKEAFNALLKTLEEPPKHAIFILATTEPEKLPETVRSRCQSFQFKRPTETILAAMVARVAKKEGFEIDVAGAELIALMGDGSYRDTHGVLQKVLSASQKGPIKTRDIEALTGAPQGSVIHDILTAVASDDRERGLVAISGSATTGTNMEVLTKLVLARMRALLLIRFAPKLHTILQKQYGDEQFAALSKLAQEATKIDSRVLLRFLEAYEQIPKAHIPHLPLELAIIDVTNEKA